MRECASRRSWVIVTPIVDKASEVLRYDRYVLSFAIHHQSSRSGLHISCTRTHTDDRDRYHEAESVARSASRTSSKARIATNVVSRICVQRFLAGHVFARARTMPVPSHRARVPPQYESHHVQMTDPQRQRASVFAYPTLLTDDVNALRRESIVTRPLWNNSW